LTDPVSNIKPGTYQPPGARGRLGNKYSMTDSSHTVTTLRVSNLSEDSRDDDLYRIFDKYGRITRVYLARDKENPDIAKGFAYVTFETREDAQKALDNAIRVGMHNCIWHLEWAKS
jgi:translation initiation factor 3 subunit G